MLKRRRNTSPHFVEFWNRRIAGINAAEHDEAVALAQLASLPVDNGNFGASGVSGVNGLGGPEC